MPYYIIGSLYRYLPIHIIDSLTPSFSSHLQWLMIQGYGIDVYAENTVGTFVYIFHNMQDGTFQGGGMRKYCGVIGVNLRIIFSNASCCSTVWLIYYNQSKALLYRLGKDKKETALWNLKNYLIFRFSPKNLKV